MTQRQTSPHAAAGSADVWFAPNGAQPASATDRYLRELKRMMLYGVVQPKRHPDLVRAVNRARDPTNQSPARSPKAVPKKAHDERR